MDSVFNVLFVCRENAARSQMAQALLHSLGRRRFVAHSAGTEPVAEIHPLALEAIRNAGLSPVGLYPKNVDSYTTGNVPRLDFIFTVCDDPRQCAMSRFGRAVIAHWPIPDPVPATGSHAERSAVFAETLKRLRRRVELFVELPLSGLDRLTMQQRLDAIGAESV